MLHNNIPIPYFVQASANVPLKPEENPKSPTSSLATVTTAAAPLEVNPHITFDFVPDKANLKARTDDPKIAEKLETYKQKCLAQKNNAIQKKLNSLTSDKLPLSLDVSNLNETQKSDLVSQLEAKGYTVSAPKPNQRSQRKANAKQIADARAIAIEAKKAERAAKQSTRAQNPKNVEDANKENAADAEILAKKDERQANVVKPNANAFPRTKKVDHIVIN